MIARLETRLMELDTEERGVWCIVATISTNGDSTADSDEQHRDLKALTPGAKVYCLPPNWAHGYEKGYEQVKVIGPHRKTSRCVAATVPAKLLTDWKAER